MEFPAVYLAWRKLKKWIMALVFIQFNEIAPS
jgi:hypothetical protein